MIKVLHVITDYPDGNNKNSTQAVKNLLESTSGPIQHDKISLIRQAGLRFSVDTVGDIIVVKVPKLPGGIFNTLLMFIAYLMVVRKYGGDRFDQSIVHGHKLTIDSVFALMFSLFQRKRLVVSVRGGTDTKWVKYKLLSRPLYWFIIVKASHVFWVSPWAKKDIVRHLLVGGWIEKKSSLLPNICFVKPRKNTIVQSRKMVFVGRLDNKDSKGLLKLIRAISSVENCRLDVIGSFSDEEIKTITGYAKVHDVAERVFILGRVDNKIFRKMIHEYCALLIPSNPETFGMAYVEALTSNVPIMCSVRSGISGYFDKKVYIELVDERDDLSIVAGIKYLLGQQDFIKSSLKKDMEGGELDFLSDGEISNYYATTISAIMSYGDL